MAQGIDIGDAVLTFLGDTTQLDAAFDKVGSEAVTKLAPADAAVKGLGESFQGAGVQGTQAAGTLADAFKLLPPVIQQTDAELQNMAFALRNVQVSAVEAGESLNVMAGVGGSEKLRVLDEAIGVRLPRGVTRFISELIPLGAVMDVAFAASVVFIVIEAVAKLVEKIVEMTGHSEKLAEAWKKVDDDADAALTHIGDEILKAEAHLDDLTGNHMGALQKMLELLDHSSLANLAKEITTIQKDVDAAFAETKTWWDYITTFGGGNQGVDDVRKQFDEITKQYQTLLKSGDRLGAFSALESGAEKAKTDLKELTQQQNDLLSALNKGGDESGELGREIAALQTKIESTNRLAKALDDYRQIQEQSNKLEQDQDKAQRIEEQKKALADLNAQESAALKSRLAAIETEKNLQHQAFEDKKISAQQWAEAQTKATLDALHAQTDYDNKLIENAKKEADAGKGAISITNASTDAREKLNKAFEAAANGLDKAKDETAKLRAEMEKLVFPVEKTKDQEKAFKELEQAERKLEDAQKTLALAQVSSDSKQQEAAIRELSKMRLISKEQEAQQLARISQQEEDKVLAILKDHLAKEKEALEAARLQLVAKEQDPLTSPEELTRLRTFFAEKQAMFTKAQTDLINAQTSANVKQLALDKSFYGQVEALAVAAGNKKIAESLRENHAALLSAQTQVADAKARGADTKAIEDQIKMLQRHEAALLKDAANVLHVKAAGDQLLKSKPNWDSFFTDLAAGALHTGEAIKEMGQMTAEGIGASVAAAVSGSKSFGEAMKEMVKQALASLAEHATVKALEEIAYGFSDLANPFMAWHAPTHFLAAAEWGAVAGGAAIAGAAIPGGSGGGKSSSASSSAGTALPAANSPALSAGSQPTQTVNVPHLSGGGLVMQDTLAVVHGGESVLPLNNRSAMRQIAGEIAAQINSAGGGTHTHHIVIESDIPYTVKKISHAVQTHRAHLLASDSIRHTPRS
jgi:hypothetical protein